MKRRKLDVYEHPSLCASWLWMQCGEQVILSCHRAFPVCQDASHHNGILLNHRKNSPFIPEAAVVRYFNAAEIQDSTLVPRSGAFAVINMTKRFGAFTSSLEEECGRVQNSD